ncbi:GreA/GreB family elongation factor [Pseudoalteromonas sp. MMG012]|uniref:GreA/GreB family elongation factor n=1 Tax=Pseudoalteromonas sp. MMG012 TaxID=2822686 RepID=UPI001B39E806|nr:GreA/GreB family elongation factor [Pseudoalteromonas sp. MMG012]MBQ4852377.1 GreA/GreB family elongation factor [Pseudoalteromonas sp. MMG012]
MNKGHVIEHIKFALEAKLAQAKQAADSAHQDATHEQSAAETQYDSLSIESGYLAHGQSERVNDIHKSIVFFAHSFNQDAEKQAKEGSLVQLIDMDDEVHWFYLGPSEGGLKVTIQQQNILVITHASPIGRVLFTKQLGDEVVLTVGECTKYFEVEAIL